MRVSALTCMHRPHVTTQKRLSSAQQVLSCEIGWTIKKSEIDRGEMTTYETNIVKENVSVDILHEITVTRTK